ncbi:transcriptional repressor TCF25-domain-containing protein [Microdochium trichocladiopsis]|uniref:Transcriptional repressor TCF25-domain-containing protein n=1 Tax=Microdochium trichocladiopsis TaxID=1682393 RepID=A0A9P9BI66_9PEZI|nr:transcriptional repressor TCF25-domain-containing protein [Microdochium trichocladiopsis]KAH7021265.1 transcriptional repressor TCF25-domain-containing protein [Microdochium trichocladiopsis]
MSSRQLRKLQKQRELEALEAQAAKEQAAQEESSEDEIPVIRSKPSTFSGFAALGGGDDDNDDEDNENDLEDDENDLEDDDDKGQMNPSRKKDDTSTAAVQETPAAGNDEDDEIDRALRELNLANKNSRSNTADDGRSPESKAYERICELLQVNTHHLKVMSEMRRMFGREAIATVHREEQEEQAAAARNNQRRGGTHEVDLETYLKGQRGQSLPEVTLRRNPFLDGKESWPKAAVDGLTMEEVRDSTLCRDDETVEFRLVHDPAYNEKEKSFFSLVQMFDPMQLVHFLHRNPYHVSTLIQVTKVAKQDQNLSLAADLCERALFTFGRVSISLFRKKMQEGKARLDFRRPENRQFWLAGYHYLSSLMHKGTPRTALEWSKLLYSMDLSDPYGLIHFIHISALKCHESAWFIDFCDSEALDECDTAQDYIRQSLVLARLQQDDRAGAKTLLIEGMERLPWLYSSLFKAIGLDVPKVIWGFTPRDSHEELYVELYVHQTKKLWDNSQATALLKEAAALASKPDETTFAPLPVVGRNLARFIYLDNTPALMGLVPDGMLASSPNWEFDPLPPLITENIFSYESQKQPWQPTGGEHGESRADTRRVRGRLRRLGGRGTCGTGCGQALRLPAK